MKDKKYEIDMVNGPLFGKLLIFALPLMVSSVLQLLFNAVDIAVVGRFTSSSALAAVGATTSLLNIFITLFIGVSIGSNVMAGTKFAIGDDEGMSEVVHTAITMAIFAGFFVLAAGCIFCRPLLELMSTPEDIIDMSVLYCRIYFASMPFFMVYNFGASILRSVGDTRRPLIFLMIAGVCNVILNLVLVIGFGMGVAGVGLGTFLSQLISCVLVARCLMKQETSYRLVLKKLHINTGIMIQILKIGIPAGIQSMLINVSNAIIQSTVNGFGTMAVAANTAANNLNGFLYMAVNAISQAGLSFTSQNMSVHNIKRVDKIVVNCMILDVIIGGIMGVGMYLLGEQLLGLYTDDPNVIAIGMINVSIICVPYFICGFMDMLPNVVRGMGHSILPMVIAIIGVVVFRFFWVYIVFPHFQTLENVYLSYPVSWVFSSIFHMLAFLYMRNREKKRMALA